MPKDVDRQNAVEPQSSANDEPLTRRQPSTLDEAKPLIKELQDALRDTREDARMERKKRAAMAKDLAKLQDDMKALKPADQSADVEALRSERDTLRHEANTWRLKAEVLRVAGNNVPFELIDLSNADPDDPKDIEERVRTAQDKVAQIATAAGYVKPDTQAQATQPTNAGAAPQQPARPVPTPDAAGTPAVSGSLDGMKGQYQDAMRSYREARGKNDHSLMRSAEAAAMKARNALIELGPLGIRALNEAQTS